MTQRHEGETGHGGPPERDPAAVSRVASRADLNSITLMQLAFSASQESNQEPFDSWVLGAKWGFAHEDKDGAGLLEVFFTLSITFDDESEVDPLTAVYRARYTVDKPGELSKQDFDQFVHWNAAFNVWPYWRELVHTMTMRSDLRPVVAPLFKMPAGAEGG